MSLSFEKINRAEILSEVFKLQTFKACQDIDILKQVIKENGGVFADVLLSNWTDSAEKSYFSLSIKIANITTVFKKGCRNFKNNYKPVSILCNLWKIV